MEERQRCTERDRVQIESWGNRERKKYQRREREMEGTEERRRGTEVRNWNRLKDVN